MKFKVFSRYLTTDNSDLGEVVVNAAHISYAAPTETGHTCITLTRDNDYIHVREPFEIVQDWLLSLSP
jgi:hypothetical protein